ncbi:unnamed protein product [Dovyalis caffra]|uniref:Uncharacterized protein n=1 Tax=Dovyalis caffra TaxID=77055 RepID=A0AAV1SC89_9ROSI|nr:unnamed protein product [Dovyalis caffra]
MDIFVIWWIQEGFSVWFGTPRGREEGVALVFFEMLEVTVSRGGRLCSHDSDGSVSECSGLGMRGTAGVKMGNGKGKAVVLGARQHPLKPHKIGRLPKP